MTDDADTVSETADDQPFGADHPPASVTTTAYGFTDQEHDRSTDFYNSDARQYDPMASRFISPDSLLPNPYDPQQLNRYAYARNNPLKYVDPSGHEAVMNQEGNVLADPADPNDTGLYQMPADDWGPPEKSVICLKVIHIKPVTKSILAQTLSDRFHEALEPWIFLDLWGIVWGALKEELKKGSGFAS